MNIFVYARKVKLSFLATRLKTGMGGWAQVNGLRGDSDLDARVQHDIYYIENWSIWLDIQIMLLTFVRWWNPSAY